MNAHKSIDIRKVGGLSKQSLLVVVALLVTASVTWLLADMAYEASGGGFLVTHNNGDGTWDMVYYSGPAVDELTFEISPANDLATEQAHDIFVDYGCQPGTGVEVPDGKGKHA
ncbi:MAG: hypothetical protein PSY12_09970 [bacterium]|nr:hypothetical protein [bacterium]